MESERRHSERRRETSITDEVLSSLSSALSKRPEVNLVPRCKMCLTTKNVGFVGGDCSCLICAEECFG